MIASNAAAQFVASPLVGRLSDRFGRRPLLIVSIAGTMVSFLLLGLAEPVGRWLAEFLPLVEINGWIVIVLFFCRILDGLAGGNVSLARAYVSDITNEEKRATGLGLIGAAFGLGFVIGPAIGGTLSNWNAATAIVDTVGLSRFAVPAFATVCISALNLLGVVLWLPESLPRQRRATPTRTNRRSAGMGGLREAFQRPQFGPLLTLRFFFSLALILFMANFALFTRYHLGLVDQITSYVMTYAGVLLILVQAVGIGWLTKRYQEKHIMLGGLVVITIALLGLALVTNVTLLLIVLLPLALSGGVLNTVLNSLISKSVYREEVGGALGLATSAESLTWVIAPTMGGLLIDYLGGWSLGLTGGTIAGMLVAFTWQHLIAKPARPLPPRFDEGMVSDGRLEEKER
jgi:DHA1 family tetracycline resistance protein-like MFS transporter